MAWFRKGSEDEDKMTVEASGIILDSLSNADSVNLIEAMTDKNLRDQISVEEALEMDKERNLRNFRWRN